MEARGLPADRTAAALEAFLRVLEAEVVVARKQLVRRHLVEADGALWPRAVETSARPESLGILLILAVAPLLARYLRALSFFAASLGAGFAPLNLVVSPLRPIVVLVSKSVAAALLEPQAQHACTRRP